jgi:hypothetical protein
MTEPAQYALIKKLRANHLSLIDHAETAQALGERVATIDAWARYRRGPIEPVFVRGKSYFISGLVLDELTKRDRLRERAQLKT